MILCEPGCNNDKIIFLECIMLAFFALIKCIIFVYNDYNAA